MINILVSLLLFAAVKSGLLWISVPKKAARPATLGRISRTVSGVSLTESHDGRGTNASLRFGLEVSQGVGAGQNLSLTYGLSTLERFMKGQ